MEDRGVKARVFVLVHGELMRVALSDMHMVVSEHRMAGSSDERFLSLGGLEVLQCSTQAYAGARKGPVYEENIELDRRADAMVGLLVTLGEYAVTMKLRSTGSPRGRREWR